MEILGWLWSLFLFMWGLEEFFFADVSLQFKNLAPILHYLPGILFVAAIMSTFPLIHRLFGKKEAHKAKAFFAYLGAVGVLTMVLHWSSLRARSTPQLPRLILHVGHCNPILGPWMQTGPGEAIVRKSVRLLPLIGQYVYWAGEDLCRAFHVRSVFENPQAFCREVPDATDAYTCFKDVLTSMSPHSKLGLLLHFQTGMKVLSHAAESPADAAALAAVGAQVESTFKLGDFVMFLNQLKGQPGAPEEILDRMPSEERVKMMDFARRFLPKNLLQPADGKSPFELPSIPSGNAPAATDLLPSGLPTGDRGDD